MSTKRIRTTTTLRVRIPAGAKVRVKKRRAASKSITVKEPAKIVQSGSNAPLKEWPVGQAVTYVEHISWFFRLLGARDRIHRGIVTSTCKDFYQVPTVIIKWSDGTSTREYQIDYPELMYPL